MKLTKNRHNLFNCENEYKLIKQKKSNKNKLIERAIITSFTQIKKMTNCKDKVACFYLLFLNFVNDYWALG